jgi:hypothetical protein
MKTKDVIAVVSGFLLMAGAVASWHWLHIDGFVAFLIAGAGLSLIGKGFKFSLDM